jgi:DNA-binding transcriptional ArsR family regulator
MDTREKIIKLIKDKGQITANEIAEYLDISRQALYKHLPDMLSGKQIIKIGRPPKVFYTLKEKESEKTSHEVDNETKNIINKNYFTITPSGEKLEGFAGFVYWCEKQKFRSRRSSSVNSPPTKQRGCQEERRRQTAGG